MSIVPDLVITSVETITAFNITTGDYLFTLDELQDASISQSEETVDVTGKNGRKLAKLKKNKTVTVSGTNGLISGGLLEMQTGGEFSNTTTEVLWTDYLTVTDNTATTSWVAVGTTGAEIEELYLKNSDSTIGTSLEQGDTAADGVFTYDPDTKVLTFSGVDDNTEIVVYYKRQIAADYLENDSDNYSGKCILYIDVLAEDLCSNVYRVQFYIPKADFNGEFSIDMGGDQVTHAFEAEALAGACGTAGTLFTYTVFGSDTEDAA